jgi:drug/metabolite transporter (DMT)-like permease
VVARFTGPLTLPAVSVTVLAWASAFVAIRNAGRYFDPGALALGRLLVGSAVLGVVLRVRGEGWPPRAAWPGIACTGVLWFGVYMVALNWGERHVDAGTAAMLINIGPMVVAVLGGWLLREGFPRRLLAGLAISFAGVVIVGLSESGGGRAQLFGVCRACRGRRDVVGAPRRDPAGAGLSRRGLVLVRRGGVPHAASASGHLAGLPA